MPENNDDVKILVQFVEPEIETGKKGFEDVYRTDGNRSNDNRGNDSESESRAAIKEAIKTVKWVADEAKTLVGKGTDRPDSVELEFGISLTTKGSMFVLQSEAQFHIKAKIVWGK